VRIEPERSDTDHDELTHNMILPVMAIGVIGLVIIVFLIFLAARWQDFSVAERSIRVASSMMQQIHRDLTATVTDYSRRADVARKLESGEDRAWITREIGRPVADIHGYDWILVVRQGSPVIAFANGAPTSFDPGRQGSPALDRLIQLARAPDSVASAATGMAAIDGVPNFVAARALDESPAAAASAAPPPVLVFARALDAPFLESLSSTSGLTDVTLLDPDAGAPDNAIPLVAADGARLGAIAWSLEQPGRQVFNKALFMIVLATPALLGLSWAFVYRARNTVYMLIERERALNRERARAEQYLSVVGSIIVALDRDGRLTLINGRGLRMLDFPADELQGHDWVETAVPPDQRAAARDLHTQVLAAADDVPVSGQYQIVTRTGSRRLMSWTATTIRDEAGTVTGVLASGEDVTERKTMEQRARQQEAELAHLLRLGTMGEMATGLAHEINQPLAAIKNYAQGAVRRIRAGSGRPEDMLEALERINAQATRAGEIIQRIRGFIRKKAPERTPMTLNDAIRGVVLLLSDDIRRLNVQLVLDLAEGLPPALADSVQVQQVVLNLARNALDVLAERRDQRRLVIRTGLDDRGWLMVTVQDTGGGVAPELLENLFEPFYTTKSEGLGMGLAISRSIVEAHQGRLWAESVPGSGSAFRFTLPSAVGETVS